MRDHLHDDLALFAMLGPLPKCRRVQNKPFPPTSLLFPECSGLRQWTSTHEHTFAPSLQFANTTTSSGDVPFLFLCFCTSWCWKQGMEMDPRFSLAKKIILPPRQTHIDLMAAKQACKLATPTTRVHTSKGCPLVRTVWGYLQLLTWTLVSCRAE